MSLSADDAKRPNLLVVVIDCLRQDRCPPDGGDLVTWPKLTSEGTCFTQMVSSASVTPVCFGSLLTGLYSFGHGLLYATESALSPAVPTLATVLKETGYSTHAFVTGPLTNAYGLHRGFDTYEFRERDEYIHTEWGDRLPDKMPLEDTRQPWFTLLHLFELHRPRQLAGQDGTGLDKPGKYDLAWKALDARLGQLLERIPEDTIVAVTSDHGESLKRRADRSLFGYIYRKLRRLFKRPKRLADWWNHGFFVYEELIRIPCVIRGPGVPGGVSVGQQVRQIDIMPTCLELLNVPLPSRLHGRSLVPLMRGKQLPECPAYLQSGFKDASRHWHGLRNESWKYAAWAGDDPNKETFLFDLRNDPGELRNVIDVHGDVAARMRDELQQLLAEGANDAPEQGKSLTEEEKTAIEEKLRALGYL